MGATAEDIQQQIGLKPDIRIQYPVSGKDKQGIAEQLQNDLKLHPVQQPAPTLGEKLSAVGQGIGTGIVNSLPVMGAIGGAVLAPETLGASIPLGTAIGAAGQHALQTTVDVPSTADLPPELRPYGYAGEVLGGSAAPAMGPIAAGLNRIPVSESANWLTRLLANAGNKAADTATLHPGSYGLSELYGAGRAAIGAGVGAALAPDNPAAVAIGGAAGGITAPVTLSAAGLLKGIFGRVRQWSSENGRLDRAATELGTILAKSGEDPKKLIAALSQPDVTGANRTSAQLTGSPALQLLEAELARRNPEFAGNAQQTADTSLTAVRKMIEKMSTSGDPATVQQAAQMRDDYFKALMSKRLEVAQSQAQQAASKLTSDSPAARAELGQRTADILGDALNQVRTVEKSLWEKVPGSAQVQPASTIAEANRIAKEDLLPEEGLPPLIAAFTKRVGEKPTNLREMLLFRTRMLDQARAAAATKDYAQARIFGQMAEATLDDISNLNSTAVDEARSYSRQLNDTFTRSFAGQALETNASGAQRIPPEALIARATAGPVEMTNMRLQELERAVRMGKPEAADELLGIQQRVLGLAADKMADPMTGIVSPARLAKFNKENGALLERFPELKQLLGNVKDANDYLAAVRQSNDAAQQAIENSTAFAKVARNENPVRAVAQVTSGPAPAQQFGQLARAAQDSGPAAVDGLRSAVLTNAYERAGGASGQFSFGNYRSALMDPPKPGEVPLIKLMKWNGVMDDDTASRLSYLLDEAAKVENTIRTRPQLAGMLSDDNALFDLALRVAGSKAVAASGLARGPGSLIVASAGSNFARKIFDKIPTGRVQDVLLEAAENPKMMAALLARPASEKARMENLRMVNAWLVGTGLASQSANQTQQGQ